MVEQGPEAVRYDVCLSFSSQDRDYVAEVVTHLQSLGVTYFYDRDEQTEIELWGKNLFEHLDQVYRVRALCCVVFVSAAYAASRWTSHELRSAQARAFSELREYILPARFDGTELPGVRPVDGYVDLSRKTPHQLAVMIAAKVAQLRGGAGEVAALDTLPLPTSGSGGSGGLQVGTIRAGGNAYVADTMRIDQGGVPS